MEKIDYTKIGEDLVKNMQGKPYGSIPKKELDLMLFTILHQNGYYKQKSKFQISQELMISETRLENLIYEMKLRQLSNQDISGISEIDIQNVLGNIAYDTQNKKIIISIPDLYVKNYLTSVLTEKKLIYDFSFNKQLLVFTLDSYVLTLELLFSNEVKTQLVEKLIKSKSISDNVKAEYKENKLQTFKPLMLEILGTVIESAAKGATTSLLGPVTAVGTLVNISNNIIEFLRSK